MEFNPRRVCRACLKNLTIDGQNLSEPIKSFYSKPSVTYLEAFGFCTGFIVDATEPQDICNECASELLISFQFKEKCTRTQNEMQKLLVSKVKDEEDIFQVKIEVFADSIFIDENEETFFEDEYKKSEDEMITQNPKREKSFECVLCGRKYSNHSNLLQHYNLKHRKHKTDRCLHCNYKQYPQFLETHIERCRSKLKNERDSFFNSNSIVEAENIFKNEDKNTEDEMMKEGRVKKNGFKCDLCGRQYNACSNLLQHYNLKHETHKTASCPHCNHKLYPQFLEKHIERCRTRRQIEGKRKTAEKGLCPICGVIKSKFHIENHLSNKTNEEKPFICDICGNKLKSKNSMILHMQIQHLKIPFKCCHCSAEFRTSQLLETHKRIIHPEFKKILKCEYCEYTSVYHASLRIHRTIHTGKKYHKCNICQKEFVKKCSLTNHRATHFDDRPFTCHLCGSTFKSRRYLRVHQRVHQENNYECPVCQRTFSSNQLLTLHAKKKHPDYQLPPPGTVMSKSFRMKIAEKRLKQEAMRKGVDKKVIEAIVVTEAPPIEELHMIQNF